MKATIERATLLRCLSHVQSVVERRNTIPILANVLIDLSGSISGLVAQEGQLVLSGILEEQAESVRQALNQIEEGAHAGADAVLVVTPTTITRRSVPAQVTYFTQVARHSPLPVLLYSVPPNTGYALDLDATRGAQGVDQLDGAVEDLRLGAEDRPDFKHALEHTDHDLLVELGALGQIGWCAKIVQFEDIGAALGGAGNDLG